MITLTWMCLAAQPTPNHISNLNIFNQLHIFQNQTSKQRHDFMIIRTVLFIVSHNINVCGPLFSHPWVCRRWLLEPLLLLLFFAYFTHTPPPTTTNQHLPPPTTTYLQLYKARKVYKINISNQLRNNIYCGILFIAIVCLYFITLSTSI